MMLRLRLMHRLGLLGPLLRAHRRVENWGTDGGEMPQAIVVRPKPRAQA
jgi:hypothetical protein